jgi:hypothetical protein
VWNCFLPRDGGSDVRLFDWDSWRLGVATEDLAYMPQAAVRAAGYEGVRCPDDGAVD